MPKPITRSTKVCRVLKAAQTAQGFTQADVAKRMKVSQNTDGRLQGAFVR